MAAFSDDFNRSDSGTVGNGWIETTDASWQVLSNKLRFTDGDAGQWWGLNTIQRPVSETFVDGAAQVEFQFVTSIADSTPQLQVRRQSGADTYYCCGLTAAGTTFYLRSVVAGAFSTTIASTAVSVAVGTNYRMRIVVHGSAISATLDDLDSPATLADLSGTNSEITATGVVALTGRTNNSIDYDNVLVEPAIVVVPKSAAYAVRDTPSPLTLGAAYALPGPLILAAAAYAVARPLGLSLEAGYSIPLSSFADDFNRSNNAVVGNSWVETTAGSWQVLSNKLRFTNAGSGHWWDLNEILRPVGEAFLDGSAQVDFQFVTAIADSNPQLHIRRQSGSNDFYVCGFVSAGTTFFLRRASGTSFVDTFDTAAVSPSVGTNYRMRISTVGDALTAQLWDLDAGTLLADLSGTNSEITTAGVTAISGASTNDIDYDNFVAYEFNPGLPISTATALPARYYMVGEPLVFLERFVDGLSAWALDETGGTVTTGLETDSVKLVLDKTDSGNEVSATRTFVADHDPLLEIADLLFASGLTGRMEILDGSDNVLAWVEVDGSGAGTFETDTTASSGFTFTSDFYQTVVFRVNVAAGTVQFWRTTDTGSPGLPGTAWTQLGTGKAYSGATPAKVRFRGVSGTGAMHADEVKVTAPDLACIGDSITAGSGNATYDLDGGSWSPHPEHRGGTFGGHDERPYPDKLGRLFSPRRWVLNRGVAGDTTGGIDARVQGDVIDQGAQRVFVMAGVNDINASTSAATIEANLQSIYDKITGAGLPLLIGTITPVDSWSSAQNTIKATVNAWIRAKENGNTIRVVETHDLVEDPGNPNHWLAAYANGDGTHPNQTGLQAIADLIYAELATVTETLPAGYAVKATVGPVTKGAGYAVKAAVGPVTKGAQYAGRTTPGATTEGAAYAVRTGAGTARTARYVIAGTGGTASVQRSAGYAVRAPGAIGRADRYAVRTRPGLARTARYVLAGEHLTALTQKTARYVVTYAGQPHATLRVGPEAHGAVIHFEPHTVTVTP